MGEVGSVAWQFERMAYFAFPSSEMDYDKAFELAIEAGADDVAEDDDMIEITGPVDTFKSIADLLHKANVNPEEAGLRMVPKQEMELGVSDTLQVMKIRGKSIDKVLVFSIVNHDGKVESIQNTNTIEIDFIIKELRTLRANNYKGSVGISSAYRTPISL